MKQDVAAELQIQIIEGLDNAVYTKDWSVARSYFTKAMYTGFSSLGSGNPAKIPADELVDAWQKNLYAGKKSFHIRGSHVVTINNNNTAANYSKALCCQRH